MSTPNSPTLNWEVRYTSEIAGGRALYDAFHTEEEALAASRTFARNCRIHGAHHVVNTIIVSRKGQRNRED